ncbi:MAG: alpha-2-macroglobulin, partial [Deltaproteobacteria bacterium]|nr:alpha-2-macroglobulin [Deltaproteobacteria bacterium]
MRRILSAVALLSLFFFWHFSGFAADPPGVESFSPQGTVKGVRQVSVRFSEQMVAFGDPRSLAEPFDIVCPAPGRGRFADGKNWIYDFTADLPAGVACTFTLKPGLKTLAGVALTGRTAFNFSTGGPAVIRPLPYEGFDMIDEEQIFILTLDAEPDTASVLQHAAFSVDGIVNPIGIRIIEGKAADKLLAAQAMRRGRSGRPGADKKEPPVVLIQCLQRFPNDARVRLIWGKGVKSRTGVATEQDQVLSYKTRRAFIAQFSCSRENPQSDCIPFLPMSINFTAPVSRELARKIVLRSADPKTRPRPAAAAKKETAFIVGPDKGVWMAVLAPNETDVSSVSFNGPFPEKSAFTIQLPPGMKDDAGRKLINAGQYPLAVRTGEYPPLAKFSGRFGILESRAGGLLPVTVRNLEASLRLAELSVAPAASKSAAGGVSGKILSVGADRGKDIQGWLRKVATVSRTKSVFTTGPKPRRVVLPKPGGAKAFEVVGIPLGRPGFYVVELESRILGQSLLGGKQPLYVQTAALVTNLSAHFKQGRESSLVWVTTLDGASPVKEAEITIRDCRDKVIWRGKTNASGIAAIAEKLPGESELPVCSFQEDENHDWRYDESYQLSGLQGGLFVTAQKGDDMTFVHGSWDKGIEPWRFQLLTESFRDPVIAHTIFDRTLLRAGDTVHMKHILREHAPSGFRFFSQAAKLPAQVAVTHSGSGQKYEFPLAWDARGTAETTWVIPKEAKLGNYAISLSGYASGGFRVEEYRIPLMKGVIAPPAQPLINAREVA